MDYSAVCHALCQVEGPLVCSREFTYRPRVFFVRSRTPMTLDVSFYTKTVFLGDMSTPMSLLPFSISSVSVRSKFAHYSARKRSVSCVKDIKDLTRVSEGIQTQNPEIFSLFTQPEFFDAMRDMIAVRRSFLACISFEAASIAALISA